MSNQSIFEKKWLEIVFENRNKEYGAYKLRQESPKTSLFAFLFGIAFLSTSVFVLSSFSNRDVVIPSEKPDVELHPVTIYDVVNPVEKKLPILETKKTDIKNDVKSKDLVDPTIVKADEKSDEVKTNEETKINPENSNTSENGTSTSVTLGTGGIGSISNTLTGNDADGKETKTILNPAMVDVKPDFPGGLKKFYEYVANHFDASAAENGSIISIFVSFVVEKDGSLTDIKVLKNPGFGLDIEAIRVLKSIKTKWKPGMVKGKPVRTSYTLPIKVKAQ